MWQPDRPVSATAASEARTHDSRSFLAFKALQTDAFEPIQTQMAAIEDMQILCGNHLPISVTPLSETLQKLSALCADTAHADRAVREIQAAHPKRLKHVHRHHLKILRSDAGRMAHHLHQFERQLGHFAEALDQLVHPRGKDTNAKEGSDLLMLHFPSAEALASLTNFYAQATLFEFDMRPALHALEDLHRSTLRGVDAQLHARATDGAAFLLTLLQPAPKNADTSRRA